MGRVARYKKVKAFDPFASASVQARSSSLKYINPELRKKKKTYKERRGINSNRNKKKHRDEKYFFDKPILQKNDFDLSDPNLTVKREEEEPLNVDGMNINSVESLSCRNNTQVLLSHIPKSYREEAKVARILKTGAFNEKKIDDNDNHQQESSKVKGRKSQENLGEFKRRHYQETLQVIKKTNDASERNNRRKEYLKGKKKQKQEFNVKSEYNDDDSDFLKNRNPQASIGYDPETAERPPIFEKLPKGMARKKKSTGVDSLYIMDKEQRDRLAVEMLREKVQSQYKLLKSRRRKRV